MRHALCSETYQLPQTAEHENATRSEGMEQQTGLSLKTLLGSSMSCVSASEDMFVDIFQSYIQPPKDSTLPISKLKDAFYTLLDREGQRGVFIRCLKLGCGLSPLLGLVGAPPYWFLREGDCSFLQACAARATRVNMTYQVVQQIPPFNQKGHRLWMDDTGGFFTRG